MQATLQSSDVARKPAEQQAVSLRCLSRIVAVPRLVKNVWAICTWTSPNQLHSYLAVTAWSLVCLWPRIALVYAAPLLPILGTVYYSQQQQQRREEGNEQERLQRVLETLDFIDYIEKAFSRHFRQDARRTFIILVYVYFGWVTAHQVLSTTLIALILGLAILTWNHPISCAARTVVPVSFIQSLLLGIFIGPLETSVEDALDRKISLLQRVENFQRSIMQRGSIQQAEFEFIIYENQVYLQERDSLLLPLVCTNAAFSQRSWPFAGWRTATFPFERSPWADASKKAVLPKSQFTLPETIQTASLATWTWAWVDSEWRLELNDKTDELGWTYGTVFWSVFDRKDKGWLSTRRRRWIRRAVLCCRKPNDEKQNVYCPPLSIDTSVPSSRSSTIELSPTPTTTSTTTPQPFYIRDPVSSSRTTITSVSARAPQSPEPSIRSRTVSSVRFSTADGEVNNDTTNNAAAPPSNKSKKRWSSQRQSSQQRESAWKSIVRVKT